MKKRLQQLAINKKKIMILTVLICFVSFVTLGVFYYFKNQNEFFVPQKTKVIFLCVTCGGMLVPWIKDYMNKKLKLFVGGVLFFAAPYIIFRFLESIVNDFSTYLPKATWWNCFYILYSMSGVRGDTQAVVDFSLNTFGAVCFLCG